MEDYSRLEKEVQELRELRDLAKREHEADKAKLHSLAEENKGLEAKVVQLEGGIRLLQSSGMALKNALMQHTEDSI